VTRAPRGSPCICADRPSRLRSLWRDSWHKLQRIRPPGGRHDIYRKTGREPSLLANRAPSVPHYHDNWRKFGRLKRPRHGRRGKCCSWRASPWPARESGSCYRDTPDTTGAKPWPSRELRGTWHKHHGGLAGQQRPCGMRHRRLAHSRSWRRVANGTTNNHCDAARHWQPAP